MRTVIRSRTGNARRPRARGQALVEFALVAPIFFLLVFSVIQLGILFGGQNGLVAATRELARYAAPFRVKTFVDATAVCADTRLTKQLSGFLKQYVPGYVAADVGSRTITYSWLPNADGTTYSVQLQVHVVYHHPLYVPIISGLLDGFDGASDSRYTLDATETMRIENEALTATYGSKSCPI
jgi:Flp pilus assembly protein TadG